MMTKIPIKNLLSAFCILLLSASFLLLTSTAFAQTPPEIKVLLDKMDRGEKLTPEEQKKFNDYTKDLSEKMNKELDKLKDLGKGKPFDPTKPVRLPVDELLPKMNLAAHYNTAVVPTESKYLALVKKYNAESGEVVAEIKTNLNQTFAQAKTGNDLSNFGMKALMGSQQDKDTSAEVKKGIAGVETRNRKSVPSRVDTTRTAGVGNYQGANRKFAEISEAIG